MKLLKYQIILLMAVVIVTSCTTKKVVNQSETNYMSTQQIINKHNKNRFASPTIKAKLYANFNSDKNKFSATVSLRIKRGKVIWLSASKFGFVVAKLKITPNNVQYYEKWNGVYFDGDFSLISKKLKVPLTFTQIENILLGQSVAPLSNKTYQSEIQEKGYELKTKNREEILQFLFLINPSNFKVNQQRVFDKEKQKSLFVDYEGYQEVNNEYIPEKVTIKAIETKKQTTVTLLYKSVTIGENLRFPFKIPQGYKEIKL